MQLIIPDVPVEVKTQIQREQLLAKEAKYQHGLKKARETEYQELIQALREQNNVSRHSTGKPVHLKMINLRLNYKYFVSLGIRGSWARRLSRISNHSDSLDAHVEVSKTQRRSTESTVWEDP